jgi:hypothetical protein
LFVTLVNPTETQPVNAYIGVALIDAQEALNLTSPQQGQLYNNRVITVEGAIPSALAGQIAKVRIDQPFMGGAQNIATVSGSTFTGQAVIRLGENSISVVGLDSSGEEITAPTTVAFSGVENELPYSENAPLVKSNLVFVLNWDTDNTDIDQYVTYSLSDGQEPDSDRAHTIWYGSRYSSVGRQDTNNTSGYGPEVTTFLSGFAQAGEYEANINYFGDHGGGNTHISVDVLLNEGSNAPIVGHRYISSSPLTAGNGGAGFPPSGDNASWKANVHRVHCTGHGVSQTCEIRQ